MLPTKYWFIWWSGFRGEDFLEINPSLRYKNGLWHHVCKRIGMKWAIFIEDLPWMLPTKFQFIWQVVSEEKIFLNRPIRNKNCLWRPCLITDRDKRSIIYRGHAIDASYQVSVHLAKRFQWEDLFKSANQKQELPMAAMFVNGSEQNEQSLERTFHKCFLPSFTSFGWMGFIED